MDIELIVLALVIVTALGFDFTNGFHDTGNAMATSIATGALKPKIAVGLAAVLNLLGAFLSTQVALTVATKIVEIYDNKTGKALAGVDSYVLLTIVFAGLIGAILWNVFTWLLGLPSSSSHALFGGLIGATIAGLGVHKVLWTGVLTSVIIPAVVSPIVAAIVAAVGTWLVYLITTKVVGAAREKGFRIGQIGSASLVSLAHGTGDAQKTMGVITLALVAANQAKTDSSGSPIVPLWVEAACAIAIALGTYSGGWRVIRTLGKGLVEIESPQGMAAEASAAAIILTSSYGGMSLSTTHVATGSILGTGIGKKGAEVRWSVAGRMAAAWVVTLPAAAIVGWICFRIAHLVPNLGGPLIIFALLIGACGWMWVRSRHNHISPDNVNSEWTDDITPSAPLPAEENSEKATVTVGAKGTGE